MDLPTKVGFIGLGNMGQPMAARLLETGVALTVLDADEKAQQAFVDQYGGSPTSSLIALASKSDKKNDGGFDYQMYCAICLV